VWQEEWERFDAREQEGATIQCRRLANQPACDVNPHAESLVLFASTEHCYEEGGIQALSYVQ
jgi:hypothetical protein